MPLLFTCPHCSIMIEITALNCGIFRCGIYKDNGQQINSHMNKEECDKIIKLKVYKLLNEMLEIGRHHNVSVIFTSHNATMGLDTKRILNECHSITLFHKNLGGKTSKYLLDGYVGMDKDQIKKLKKVNSRWVTILKTYPQMVISEKEAYVLNPTE